MSGHGEDHNSLGGRQEVFPPKLGSSVQGSLYGHVSSGGRYERVTHQSLLSWGPRVVEESPGSGKTGVFPRFFPRAPVGPGPGVVGRTDYLRPPATDVSSPRLSGRPRLRVVRPDQRFVKLVNRSTFGSHSRRHDYSPGWGWAPWTSA